MVMRPDSSGSRSTSSTRRSNSVNSSRNSTPWWASEISPGRGLPPPPTIAGPDAVWCGARHGRCAHSSARKPPGVRLMTVADSSASCSDIGGSSPGSHCASIDLPVPGGPTSSAECWQAAATSIARRACTWQAGVGQGADVVARLAQRGDGVHREVFDQRGLGTVARRHHEGARRFAGGRARGVVACQAHRHGERATYRAQFAGQRQLGGIFMVVECLGRNLAAGGQDAQCDRQVEAARLLGQVGRRQVDGSRRLGNS